MNPLLGALITGGSSLLGSMFSSETSAENTAANIAMQQQTNQMNVQEAQKNRDFQEQMSNTAYQRASKDMTSAGLNPAMMFGSGGPASSPGGAMATNVAPKSEKTSALAGLGKAAEAGMQTAVQVKTMEKMADEMALLQAEKMRTDAATDLTRRQEVKTAEEVPYVREHTKLTESLRRAAETSALEGDAMSKASPALRDTLTRWGYYGRKASDAISPLLSTARTVSDFLPYKSTREGATQFVRDTYGDLVGTDTFEKMWRGRIGR